LTPPQAGRWNASNPLPTEVRLNAAAIALERAVVADRIGALEDPVLPRAQAAEDLGLHRLRAGEAQVCLHRAQRIRREAGAPLEHDPQFVVPVEILDRGGDEPERFGHLRFERRADLFPCAPEILWLAKKARRQPRQAVAHRIESEIRWAERDGGGRAV